MISHFRTCRAPFDTAILVFIAMCFLLVTNWSENYGDANAPVSQSFRSAWTSIKSGRTITKMKQKLIILFFDCLRPKNLSVGYCSSTFRSINVRFCTWMDTCSNRSIKSRFNRQNRQQKSSDSSRFVFLTKKTKSKSLPRFVVRFVGYVFASYMVAMMMGTNSFKVLCNYATPESFMRSQQFLLKMCSTAN